MTKEEVLDEIGTLLDLLDAVPNGTSIISATVQAPYLRQDRRTIGIQIEGDIALMAHRLRTKVERHCASDPKFIHLKAFTAKSEIVKVTEKEAAPGDDSTRDGEAAQSATSNTTIIDTEKEEVKP